MRGIVLAVVLPMAAVLAVLALGGCAGRRRFRSMVASEVAELLSEASQEVGPEQRAARWTELPEPVRRYLRYAIPSGAPALRRVRLKHDGFMRMRPGVRWIPLRGEEHFAVARPGFVWHATARTAPLCWIEARDHLLAGRGSMLVKLASMITVANARGREIDQGARMRWLAEAVWFPYGFLGDQVGWEAIDDRSARATLRGGEGDLPVSVVIEVDGEGRLVRIRGDRYRDVGGGRAVLTPWSGRCQEYLTFDGFRVPSEIEVSWGLADGEFACFRSRVTAFEPNLPVRS